MASSTSTSSSLSIASRIRWGWFMVLFGTMSVILFEGSGGSGSSGVGSVLFAMGAEMSCEADGTCNSNVPPDQAFEVTVENKSPYRADIYWDDGGFGQNIGTVEANGGTINLSTYRDYAFFITRHGVKEGLFNVETDTQYRFISAHPQQVMVIPKTAAPSKNLCQDRFSVCQDYANRGQCWESPGWMIVHCCKSCDEELNASQLIDPAVRCSKENLNITNPVWAPGDLNTLFATWATDPKFSKYNPTVLSSPDIDTYGGSIPNGPWVMTFDDFFTAEEANALITGGESVGFDRSTNQGAVNDLGEMEQVVSTTRTSSNAWCVRECAAKPEIQAVSARIEKVTGIPQKNFEPFQVLEYQHDQFYRMHHDSEGRDTKPPGNRILTFFLYLSDVEEGGETHFNKLNLSVKPKLGRALVWPSVLNDEPDFWDDRMYHEAKDVIQGKKYAANHWIHLNDYEGPNIWGCTGSFS